MAQLYFWLSKSSLKKGESVKIEQLSSSHIGPSVGMNTDTNEIFIYSHCRKDNEPFWELKDAFLVATVNATSFLSLVDNGILLPLDWDEIAMLYGYETAQTLEKQDILKLNL